MTTITDIRNDLINVFNALRAGTMEAKEAVEINNTAGKIISSAKVQLAHAALRGEKPNIPFLMGDVEPALPIASLTGAEVVMGQTAPKALPANSAFPDAMMHAMVKGKT